MRCRSFFCIARHLQNAFNLASASVTDGQRAIHVVQHFVKVPVFQILADQLHQPLQGRKRRFQVVADRIGELGQFLVRLGKAPVGVAQFLVLGADGTFGRDPFGQVGHRAHDHVAFGRGNRRQRDFDRDRFPAFVFQVNHPSNAHPSLVGAYAEICPIHPVCRTVPVVDKVFDTIAQQFVAIITGEFQRRLVDQNDCAAFVDHRHGGGRRLHRQFHLALVPQANANIDGRDQAVFAPVDGKRIERQFDGDFLARLRHPKKRAPLPHATFCRNTHERACIILVCLAQFPGHQDLDVFRIKFAFIVSKHLIEFEVRMHDTAGLVCHQHGHRQVIQGLFHRVDGQHARRRRSESFRSD